MKNRVPGTKLNKWKKVPEPKFKAGQVVCIIAESYTYQGKGGRYDQRFQRIEKVWPWSVAGECSKGWGLSLSNGDECHEKFARPQTEQERGDL